VAEHKVETVFTLTDQASGPLKNMASQMQFLQNQAQKANGGLERLLVPVLGFVGLGMGVKSFAHKLYEVDEAARDVTSTIAAAYIASDRFAHAGPGKALAASMKRGEEAFESIEDMATRGVAPMKVYAGVYKAIALPALERTKLTQKELLGFTEDLVPVLGAVTGNVQMAAFQAKQFGNILATGGGRPPKELLKVIGMTTKEFDKLRKKGVEPMFAEIAKRVHENAPQFKALFEDPSVMFGRLRATADQLFRILGQPVMETLNQKAQELLKYISENKEHVFEIARLWGEKISVGFEKAVALASLMKDHVGAIAIAIAGIKFAPQLLSAFSSMSGGAGAGAGGAASAGVAAAAAASAASAGVAAAAGASAASAGVAAAEKVAMEHVIDGFTNLGQQKAPWLGTAFDKLGEKINSAAGFSGKVGAASNMLVGMVGKGPLVIGGLVALYESLDWAAGKIDEWQASEIKAKGNVMNKDVILGQLRGQYGASQEAVVRTMGRLGVVSKEGKINIGQYGEQLMKSGVDAASKDMAFALKAARALAEAMTPEQIAAIVFPTATTIAEKAISKPPVNDFRGSTFNIKQAFAEGFDPDRIAVAFTQDLVALGERKIMSGLSPILGMP